jgi:isochorismate hydrolase
MPGIPAIESYQLPTTDQLPTNVADWRIDRHRVVLLIHDMQRYFLRRFPADSELPKRLVDHIGQLRERCQALGIPVAYSVQPGGMTSTQRGLLKDFWGPGMSTAAADRDVVEPLAPEPTDWVATKWRYSAFFRSDLLERMRAHGREQVIICGVYAHVGVLMTAVDAFTNDIQPFLVADAVGDFTETHHRQAIGYAAQNCAMVVTLHDVLSQLEPA